MLYRLLKLYARLALHIYCPYLWVNKPEILAAKGPLLLAANHPNSFLDGIILTTLFDRPVYSLARGDAFRNKWVDKILRHLQLLPVYRTSEGVENLEHNYTTFSSCIDVFKQGGIVLIFSEGRCENEWHLRPLRKGTARLATTAWEAGIPLQVLPTGFNYSSFKQIGKVVHLLFGHTFSHTVMEGHSTHGRQLLAFNNELQQQLQQLVYEIDPHHQEKVKAIFKPAKTIYSKVALWLPALVGAVVHAPLYFPLKAIAQWRFGNSGHYDSVLTTLLILLYPLYILLLIMLALPLMGTAAWLLAGLLPVTAWAFTICKVSYELTAS